MTVDQKYDYIKKANGLMVIDVIGKIKEEVKKKYPDIFNSVNIQLSKPSSDLCKIEVRSWLEDIEWDMNFWRSFEDKIVEKLLSDYGMVATASLVEKGQHFEGLYFWLELDDKITAEKLGLKIG